MKKIYVVFWEYGDHSGHGIIGFSPKEKEAKFVCDLLTEHGSGRQFSVVEVDSLEAPE